MPTTHSFCRICESLCGLELDVEGGRVSAIRPDAQHVASSGFACVKGLKQHLLFDSPDRLRRPLTRDGDALRPSTWDTALAGIGAAVRRIRSQHGPDSIALDLADLRSATATLRVPIQLLPDLQPGSVALPHGWGHQIAPSLSVASATEGVNVNLLAADGPDAIEPLSGMARLTAIPVEVTRAAGPRNPRSWSGLPVSEEMSIR
jgi:anaerobic selenocysteine-containing dehydrogenase